MRHFYRSCLKTGVLLFALLFSGSLSPAHAQIINTIAGTGLTTYNGEGAPAISKNLNLPFGVAVDGTGNVYVSEQNNNRIRKITPGGVISTFAGTGAIGFPTTGGPATACDLFNPYGIAADPAGNIYIADQGAFCILKVNTAGVISMVAGSGSAGYTGDGAAASLATLQNPTGVAVDATGNLYIADYGNNVVRKVNTSGIISTFAGTGSITPSWSGDGGPATAAHLWNPEGIAVDAAGNVYIAEFSNSVIRKVNTAGIIQTIAGVSIAYGFGGDGGPAASGILKRPTGLAVGPDGNLYIADIGNGRIRKINNTTGTISTFAGTSLGFSGDGGPASTAQLNNPSNVAFDNSGNLYIADQSNNRVREITFPLLSINPIVGKTDVCVGQTTNLSNASTGGTWTSGNTGVATVDVVTGVVTGVSAGNAVITYQQSGGFAFANVTVGNPTAALGKILGLDRVCPGFTVILSNYIGTGVWSSSNPGVSTVTASGIVYGIAPGKDTIFYTVTTACGTAASLKYPFTVQPYAECPTGVASVHSQPGAMNIWPNPSEGTFAVNIASEVDEAAYIVVTNITGEKIKEFTTVTNMPSEMKLNVPGGIYFLNGVTVHGNWNQKLVIAH